MVKKIRVEKGAWGKKQHIAPECVNKLKSEVTNRCNIIQIEILPTSFIWHTVSNI